jgi:hypothetical protein
MTGYKGIFYTAKSQRQKSEDILKTRIGTDKALATENTEDTEQSG